MKDLLVTHEMLYLKIGFRTKRDTQVVYSQCYINNILHLYAITC